MFWMGRYLERAEHIARFTRVQFMSSVDAPVGQSRETVLASILEMSANRPGYFAAHPELHDEAVLTYTTIAENNPFSILAYLNMVRENARGARDSISIELWESINSFYHRMNAFAEAGFHSAEIEYFTKRMEESSYVIKGHIDNTLLRNEVWMLLSLDMHLERAVQVCLILLTKLKDIEKLDAAKQGGAVETYQWMTTLQSIESFDMFMRCQKTSPTKHTVLDFLLFDSAFPKSIAFSLACVKQYIEGIPFQEDKKKGSLNFIAGKLACHYQYNTIEDIETSPVEFLETTLQNIYDLAHLLDVKYLKYN